MVDIRPWDLGPVVKGVCVMWEVPGVLTAFTNWKKCLISSVISNIWIVGKKRLFFQVSFFFLFLTPCWYAFFGKLEILNFKFLIFDGLKHVVDIFCPWFLYLCWITYLTSCACNFLYWFTYQWKNNVFTEHRNDKVKEQQLYKIGLQLGVICC